MGGSSSKNMTETYEAKQQSEHTSTLIFLHGLGDTGQSWAMNFESLKLKHIKCICPTAPIMPVTLNAGFKMPSWFDIASLQEDQAEDEDGIIKASEKLKKLIEAEELRVPSENIFIGGFSQGGAVAMYTAFTIDKPLAGVIGLSTWMPLRTKIPQGSRDIPVFQAHGTIDHLVPIVWGRKSGNIVSEKTTKYTFKEYPIMHASCQEEMNDVKKFLEEMVKG